MEENPIERPALPLSAINVDRSAYSRRIVRPAAPTRLSGVAPATLRAARVRPCESWQTPTGETYSTSSQTARSPGIWLCLGFAMLQEWGIVANVVSQEKTMKKLSILAALAGAVMLSMSPLSVHLSASRTSLTIGPATASAAELDVPAYRRAYRHGRYYRSALYDPFCGGPYVGPGWNGGTYWGGPWMDLRCYGVRDEVVVRARY